MTTEDKLKLFFVLDVIILIASSLGLVSLVILSFVRNVFEAGIIPCAIFTMIGIWEMPRYKRYLKNIRDLED